MTTIQLTSAQRSALECAGLDYREGDVRLACEIALRAAWDGPTLTVTPQNYAEVLEGICERSNAEDGQHKAQGDERARRASVALTNIAARVIRLRRAGAL